MIETYIQAGYVPVNKETVLQWLKESIAFTTNLLTYDTLKDNKALKIELDTEKNIILSLETGLKYEDFKQHILSKIKLCENNRDYFKSINKDYAYWDVEITLYKHLIILLDELEDYYSTQKGQLYLF